MMRQASNQSECQRYQWHLPLVGTPSLMLMMIIRAKMIMMMAMMKRRRYVAHALMWLG